MGPLAKPGDIRIRPTGKQKTRFIKVRDDGPIAGRWMQWARWWWIQNHGPVPEGQRVVYLDGDTMNDDTSNIGLATPGDVFFIAGERDPEMLVRNRQAASAGTARYNRERAKKLRAKSWLPTRWYAVFPDRGTIVNKPQKSRNGIVELYGGHPPKNGRFDEASLPFVIVRGRDLAAKGFAGFRRVPKTSPADRAIVQASLPEIPVIAPNPSGLCQCGCGLEAPKATSNCVDVSVGQYRRFVLGHYQNWLRKTVSPSIGAEARAKCVRIATEVSREVAPFRWEECLGPAFEAALQSCSRGKGSIAAITAACRAGIKKHFGGEIKRGVSIDALIAVGREPSRNERIAS